MLLCLAVAVFAFAVGFGTGAKFGDRVTELGSGSPPPPQQNANPASRGQAPPERQRVRPPRPSNSTLEEQPDPPRVTTEDFQDSFDRLSGEWHVLVDGVACSSGDLVLGARARVQLRLVWDRPFQIRLPYMKFQRHADLTVAGYRIRFGGRDAVTELAKQKYGTHISLFQGDKELQLVPSNQIGSQEQVLTVQVRANALRVYLQRLTDNKYLHGDGAWRDVTGPCIVHETSTIDFAQPIALQQFNSPGHQFHDFVVTAPEEFPDEEYFAPPSDVPSLADDGLTLPEFKSPWTHIGLAYRADGADFPVDDPSLLSQVSISPFGPPPDFPGASMAYMTATIWNNSGEWNAWTSYCAEHDLDPAIGKIGPLAGESGGSSGFAGGSEIGVKNLAAAELCDWLAERAESLSASGKYGGIFWDVAAHPGVSFDLGYTGTQWADLQGKLYRRVWKASLAPRGQFPMINIGNYKTDRNRRVMEWVPIVYLDRQLLPETHGWNWYEQTVITNPRYRNSVFGDHWISVLDGIGGDSVCLDENDKYGWLTAYYQRLATLGGYQGRHFLGGGFNGDYKADGNSGRHEWRARHYVPAMTFDVGQPKSEVTIAEDFNITVQGKDYRGKLFQAEFEHATIYHFPQYMNEKYESPSPAPPHTVNFETPMDVLRFDGTWLENQSGITIPAGSGRIIRPAGSGPGQRLP